MTIDFESRLTAQQRLENMLRRVTNPDGSPNHCKIKAEEKRLWLRIMSRKPINAAIRTMLENIVRNMEGVNKLAQDTAVGLGLEAIGILDEIPERATVLDFPLDWDNKLSIKWDKVDAQLETIGTPTGMYTVPKKLLMGIRGTDADILIRLIDIVRHRLDGVFEHPLFSRP